ncbi:hypothetical protein GCM10020256_00440 [Streptomyces thermocoprophilus]
MAWLSMAPWTISSSEKGAGGQLAHESEQSVAHTFDDPDHTGGRQRHGFLRGGRRAAGWSARGGQVGASPAGGRRTAPGHRDSGDADGPRSRAAGVTPAPHRRRARHPWAHRGAPGLQLVPTRAPGGSRDGPVTIGTVRLGRGREESRRGPIP